jgi:hypothetical protein
MDLGVGSGWMRLELVGRARRKKVRSHSDRVTTTADEIEWIDHNEGVRSASVLG